MFSNFFYLIFVVQIKYTKIYDYIVNIHTEIMYLAILYLLKNVKVVPR